MTVSSLQPALAAVQRALMSNRSGMVLRKTAERQAVHSTKSSAVRNCIPQRGCYL